MTQCPRTELATHEVRPVFRFLASIVALFSLVFGVASWVWSFGEPGLVFMLLMNAGLFGQIAKTGRFVSRSSLLRRRLHLLARLCAKDRITLVEFGERTRKMLADTTSLDWQETRPVSRSWIWVLMVVCAGCAVAAWFWGLPGWKDVDSEFFYPVLIFYLAYLAANGSFGGGVAMTRIRLHELARLYIANRMTLEEYGERTRKALDPAAS